MKIQLEKWFSLLQDQRQLPACGDSTAAAITFDEATFPHDIREKVIHGASVLFVFTAAHVATDREFFSWEIRVAAMQNNAFILAGISDAADHIQEFIAANPFGESLTIATDNEGHHYTELSFALVHESRKRWPFVKLLRSDLL